MEKQETLKELHTKGYLPHLNLLLFQFDFCLFLLVIDIMGHGT